MFKYYFLIGNGNDKNRKVFIMGETPADGKEKLQKLIDKDNKKKKRNTVIIKYVGI